MILKGGKTCRSKIHNKIILPMSISNIVQSIAMALSTLSIPATAAATTATTIDDTERNMTANNRATCTAQGFFIQLGYIGPTYNAILCLYFLFIIKFNIRDKDIQQKYIKYEPFMHTCAILPPLIVAILTVSMNLFNEETVCWMAQQNDYDDNYDDASINKGKASTGLLLPFLNGSILAIILIDFLTVTICMFQVVKSVHEREVKMDTYRFRRPSENPQTSMSTIRNNFNKASKDTLDTKVQAFIYVMGFFLTNVFTAVSLVMTLIIDAPPPFALLLLQGMFQPSYGIYSFLAYIRPKYMLISADYPEKNIFQKLYITITKKRTNSGQLRRKASRRRQSLRRKRKMLQVNSATDKDVQPTHSINEEDLVIYPHEEKNSDVSQAQGEEPEDIKFQDDEVDMNQGFAPTLALFTALDFNPSPAQRFRRRSMIDVASLSARFGLDVDHESSMRDFDQDFPVLDFGFPMHDASSHDIDDDLEPSSPLTCIGIKRSNRYARRNSCPSLQSSIDLINKS
jgi:hypothetical protein